MRLFWTVVAGTCFTHMYVMLATADYKIAVWSGLGVLCAAMLADGCKK